MNKLVLIFALLFATVCVLQLCAGQNYGGGRNCGGVCYIGCPYGNVLDYRGCPICRCKERPSSGGQCPLNTRCLGQRCSSNSQCRWRGKICCYARRGCGKRCQYPVGRRGY